VAKRRSQIDSIVDPIVIWSRGLKHRIRNRPKMSVYISSFIQKLIGNDENLIDSFARPQNAKSEREETPYGISMWRRLASAKTYASIRDNLYPTLKLMNVSDKQE
jgi:hypothetical protein